MKVPVHRSLILIAAWEALSVPAAGAGPGETAGPRFVDLSLLVDSDHPSTWPTWPRFRLVVEETIGARSAYHVETLFIDGNTGTQLDVPTHSVTPPGSGLPNAGEFGNTSTDRIPAWQFGGEACVIDCRDLLDQAPPGRSPLIRRERIEAWEKAHRPLRSGDVVLFRSGYSDRYYRPLPEGRRFGADPLAGAAPAWPDPDPECMEYLAARGVRTLGTDSVSMGPLPDLAEPTHYAGLRHGMIWTESATGLGELPPTGAFYCMIGPKHFGGPYAEGRAFAVVGEPLAPRLIEAARNRRATDLSVTLAEELPVTWPGRGIGNHRQPYFRIRFGLNPNTRTPFETHLFDSQAGTHLVPPAHALPPPGGEGGPLPPGIGEWLAEYEKTYGPRGTSDLTAEKVPLAWTCGPARVIDVRGRLGTAPKETWPASPAIRPEDLQEHEKRHGSLNPGDVVIFRSDWSDRYLKPLPEGKACLEDPLNGLAEGWPAPGPEAILYLAGKGIRCVATDAPTLGGVDPKRALFTYWALGGKSLAGVEFLTNLGSLEDRQAYVLFAAVKIRGCHGGPGRAVAFY